MMADWGFSPRQGLGGTNDLPTVAELIERIVAEAEQALESSRGKALA